MFFKGWTPLVMRTLSLTLRGRRERWRTSGCGCLRIESSGQQKILTTWPRCLRRPLPKVSRPTGKRNVNIMNGLYPEGFNNISRNKHMCKHLKYFLTMTHFSKRSHTLFLSHCLNRYQTKHLEQYSNIKECFLFQHGLNVDYQDP